MKGISRFFTLYWVVYFPTCIAFNDLPGFSSIDEIMTGILIFVTFAVYLTQSRKWRLANANIMKEYVIFLAILAGYTLYSLRFGANVAGGVWLDLIQEIRPFSIIFCTWLLNPQFSKRQRLLMVASMVITLFVWIYLHPTGVTYGENGEVIRSEFPVLGQMAICTGMAWYLLTNPTETNKWIALALVLTGMIAPKYKFLGEVVVFIAIIFFVKRRFNFRSARTLAMLSTVVAIVLFISWSRFDAYYVSGLDEDIARPATYRTAFGKILWDYFPFGSGMGSFACNGAWKYYSPLYPKYGLDEIWGLDAGGGFIADAYYPTLAQFGVVGIILFVWFWKRRLTQMNEIIDMRYYRVAWMAFFCLAIEQVADSSWLSGKGMGYCMLIGLCLNANRNLKSLREKRKKQQLILQKLEAISERRIAKQMSRKKKNEGTIDETV